MTPQQAIDDAVGEMDQRNFEAIMIILGHNRIKRENGEVVWVKPGYLWVGIECENGDVVWVKPGYLWVDDGGYL